MKQETKSAHSVFAFSASPRWISCPGSMAYAENIAESDGGPYAAEGTAAHTVAQSVLEGPFHHARDLIGQHFMVGKHDIEVTEEFADHVQTYVDDVDRRAMGGYLLVEQQVTLEGIEGFDESNYGTSDAIIAMPNYGVIEDLKFGVGEKVYAWEYAKPGDPFTMIHYIDDVNSVEVVPNYQLMMYALAARRDIEMLSDDIAFIRIVINQPRLGHVSELDVHMAVLDRFALFAADALAKAMLAKSMGVAQCEEHDKIPSKVASNFFNPGEKQCRWCKAAACKARAKKVQADVAADFDTIAAVPPAIPSEAQDVSRALQALPFIKDWCNAVLAKAHELVGAGIAVMGPDDKPYKFVEGKQGNRAWADEKAAEAALVGQLADNAYQPRKVISAAQAAKIFDKKKTEQLWNDIFAPLIKRAPGKPQLALGSDPRAPFSGAADSDEFEDVNE